VFESPSSQMLSLISSYWDYNGSIFTQSNITNKQGYSTNNKLITTNDEDISITDVSVNDVFWVIGNDVVYQCKLISQDDSDGSDDVYFAWAPISDNIDPPQPTEVE
jgi:hypothetical protein